VREFVECDHSHPWSREPLALLRVTTFPVKQQKESKPMRRFMMLILGVVAYRMLAKFLDSAEGRRAEESVAALARARAPRRRARAKSSA